MFAAEHYPSQDPSRIEWIDDTSANIVYPTEETAVEALHSFLRSPQISTTLSFTELRPAKLFSTHPHFSLQVRQANSHDVKKRNAHETSRFYLLNPEHDPRERRRSHDNRRGKGRDDRRYKRRRSDVENVPFDVNMYDDDAESLAKRAENERRSKKARFEGSRDDLFAERIRKDQIPRLRNRSASPGRLVSDDGRFGFDPLDEPLRPSPPVRTRSRANANTGKELLSSPAASARSFLRHTSPAPRELFPEQAPPVGEISNTGKELLANGAQPAHHRRTDAFDAADETDADMEGSPTTKQKSRNLADRVTGGPALRLRDTENQNSNQSANPGFTIKGVAKEVNPRVKELFPDKVGSDRERELFAPRRRAEDLF